MNAINNYMILYYRIYINECRSCRHQAMNIVVLFSATNIGGERIVGDYLEATEDDAQDDDLKD